MFGSKKKLDEKLAQQGGVVAWATVLEAQTRWETADVDAFNQVRSTTEHMTVRVRVEPDGGQPFEAEFKQTFKRQPFKGWQCKVTYDPNDHSKIVVHEDSITPPGIDHAQADRATAMRTEMLAAAKSGHIADYIEEMKARAAAGDAPGVMIAGGQVISPSGAAAPDVYDRLDKLAGLRDRGVLTEAEFEAQKAKLLADS